MLITSNVSRTIGLDHSVFESRDGFRSSSQSETPPGCEKLGEVATLVKSLLVY